MNLTDLCKAIFMPLENCTCERMGIMAMPGSDLPDFCEQVKEKQIIYLEEFIHHHTTLELPIIVTIVAILAIIGNIMVVWIHRVGFAKRTRHTFLVTSLAICDIFFACIALLYYIPQFITDQHWIYGQVGCKLVSGTTTIGAWVAIGIIFIIAVERFLGIVYPFRRGMTNQKMYLLLIVNVIVAICFAIPRLIHLQLHHDTLDCHEEWIDMQSSHLKAYDWSIFAFYSLIPVFCISILYCMIFRSLKKSINKCKLGVNEHMEIVNAERLRNNRKSMVLLVTVLIAFVFFTFPNKIRWILQSSSNESILTQNRYFVFVTEAMYPLHLAVNPIIYASSNRQFRRIFRKSVDSIIRKQRSMAISHKVHSFTVRSRAFTTFSTVEGK